MSKELGLPTPDGGKPDFSNIIQSETLSLGQKRAKILQELGVKKKKKKYATPDERKAAARERAKQRRAESASVLEEYGLKPSKRGPRKTKEQRKATAKRRRERKKDFMQDMAKQNPSLAKKYGIDVTRFK